MLSCCVGCPHFTHHPHCPLLAHAQGVRTWHGDVVDLPPYLTAGTDAVFMNACFGNMFSPRDALLKAALAVKPGGYVVVSHPMGRAWHSGLKESHGEMVSFG